MSFNCFFYRTWYDDLYVLDNDNKCRVHWHRHGKKENRITNKNSLNKKELKLYEFKVLINNIKSYNCPCKKSLNNIPFRNLWNFLHKLSYNYTIEYADLYKDIINRLKKIKCEYCRNHYIKYCNKINIDEVSREKELFINFFFNCHNEINKRNRKKIYTRGECDKLYTK